MRGLVFDIQNYALYDGPGIRTAIYLKGCPLSCAWCHNPESRDDGPRMLWRGARCAHCGACVEACPESALTPDNERIVRDAALCVVCGACEEVCPNEAMETVGYEMEAEALAEIAARDRPFFEQSGGGVTFTGGEPTRQLTFLREAAGLLRQLNIHVAMETCGYFPSSAVDPLAASIDLILFDLKHPDPERHKAETGVDPAPIFRNFREMLQRVGSDRLTPRIPIIPGYNDDDEATDRFLDWLIEAGHPGPAHLLPYHNWSRGKYEGLGLPFRDFGKLSEARKQEIQARYNRRNFSVVWGG